MIAALIFVVSAAAFLQFFVSYCRSILESTRTVNLSDRVRQIAGIVNGRIAAADFERVLRLVHLCPGQCDDLTEIRAVTAYYRLLNAFYKLASPAIPKAAAWAEQECSICSYFAVVALERRIVYSHNLVAQQSNEL